MFEVGGKSYSMADLEAMSSEEWEALRRQAIDESKGRHPSSGGAPVPEPEPEKMHRIRFYFYMDVLASASRLEAETERMRQGLCRILSRSLHKNVSVYSAPYSEPSVLAPQGFAVVEGNAIEGSGPYVDHPGVPDAVVTDRERYEVIDWSKKPHAYESTSERWEKRGPCKKGCGLARDHSIHRSHFDVV